MAVSRYRRQIAAPRSGATSARLAQDTRGAVAIEFAFIAAPMAALLVAVLQTTLVFFAQQTLETTAEKSTRILMTGKAQQTNMTKDKYREVVCANLPAFMACDNVIVDVQSSSSFASISTSVPTITYDGAGKVNNNWKFQPGGAGTINIVRIMYIWDVAKGPLGYDLATLSSGKRLLYATAVFKTEPYT